MDANTDKPPFDPSQPFDAADKPPFDPSQPFEAAPVGGTEAFGRGTAQGLTAGFSDELRGLAEAGGAKADEPMSLGHVLYGSYKYLRNNPDAVNAYDAAVKREREANTAAQTQHPLTYGGGELAGAIVPMVAAAPEAASTFGARAMQAAKVGAGYGAVAGAGESEGGAGDRLASAGTGAASGLVGGLGGELAVAGLGRAASYALNNYAAPAVSAVRGLLSPEAEPARRVAGALTRDYPQVSAGVTPGMTPTQWAAAKAAGEPVMLADLGGETTRALMRSAANTSPEGRAALQQVIGDRFAQQNDRAGMTVRSLISGGADTAKTKAQLEAEYDLERSGAYKTAYEAGDRPIWSPTLERLTSAPSVAGALRGAVNKWKDWQVLDGFGAMNPPVKVTPDGMLQFGQGKGLLPYPNLQLWDYAARNLAGEASAAFRAGNNQEAARIGGLEKLLKAELDKQVPEFGNARGIAATYFGGNNAIDAAREAVSAVAKPGSKGDPYQIARVMAGMKPAEREMFQESYADALAQKMEGMRDQRDVTTALFNSPTERKKIGAVFGQGGVDKLQAFVNRERIYDAARKAMGNSTTVQQMIAAGLAGGATSGWITGGDLRSMGEGFVTGAIARKMAPEVVASGVRTAVGYVDRATATRVANLLASNDPTQLAKGLQIAAKNQRIGNALRGVADRIATTVGVTRTPRFQLPSPVAASNQQPNIPGPVNQQKNGGRVDQQNGFAHGGTVSDNMRTIQVIRHGATKLNNDDVSVDRIRSWKNIPLSKEGEQEAHTLGACMTKETKPDILVSSNLKRAHDTARIVSKKIGVPIRQSSTAFRPWNLGTFAGQKSSQAVPVIADYATETPDKKVPGGESFNDFKRRFFTALYDLLRSNKGIPAIVTHHRNERLLRAWEKAGYPADGSVDHKEFTKKGEHTAQMFTMQVPLDRLREAARARYASGGRVDEGKVSKASVNYRAGGLNNKCSECTMFREPNACSHVAGYISPEGTCDDFERKEVSNVGRNKHPGTQ